MNWIDAILALRRKTKELTGCILKTDAPVKHVHKHELRFLHEDSFEWEFVCECGHKTTDIYDASPP
jgi:hypothetical protein